MYTLGDHRDVIGARAGNGMDADRFRGALAILTSQPSEELLARTLDALVLLIAGIHPEGVGSIWPTELGIPRHSPAVANERTWATILNIAEEADYATFHGTVRMVMTLARCADWYGRTLAEICHNNPKGNTP